MINLQDENKIQSEMLARKLRDQLLTAEEKTFLQQDDPAPYAKADSIEHETKKLLQELQRCRTKQDAAQTEASYLEMIRAWCTLAENSPSISPEQKIGYTLFKHTLVSAVRNAFQEFTESNAYENLPDGTAPPQSDQGDRSTETDDLCHIKAQRSYQAQSRISEGRDEQKTSSLNTKG